MGVRLLTKQYLEFLSYYGGCTGSSESIQVKMPHSRKSHVAAHINDGLTHICLFVLLFDLFLYVPSTIIQLNRDGSSWVEPVLS